MKNKSIKNIKILFVDDEDGIRDSFTSLLKMWGSQVVSASNGKEGLEAFIEFEPDIVVTDIKMPVMDGLEMCDHIKKLNPDVPIIIATAFEEAEYLLHAIKNKVDDYLVKPIRKKELKTKLIELSESIFNKKLQEFKCNINHLFLDITGVLMVALDDACNIKMLNKTGCRILGLKEEEIIGKNWFDIDVVPEDQQNDLKKYYNSLLKGETNLPKDNLLNDLIDKEGKRLKFIWLNIVLKENGAIIGVFSSAISTDNFNFLDNVVITKKRLQEEIEKRKKIEQLLKDQEYLLLNQSKSAAMGDMISIIAHQWRQPLSIISMNANNILADIDLGISNEENLKEVAGDILIQTTQMSETIDDFRDFFKPSKEISKINYELISNKIFKFIGKSLEHHNIVLEQKFNKDVEFQTLERELIQVLINIIKNAKDILIQKNNKEKIINITFDETTQGDIEFKISDNGGGIPEVIIDKIFDKYFTTKENSDGTGLGLYLSKAIIEDHLKGSIQVKNENGGACFYITFPKKLEKEFEKEI